MKTVVVFLVLALSAVPSYAAKQMSYMSFCVNPDETGVAFGSITVSANVGSSDDPGFNMAIQFTPNPLDPTFATALTAGYAKVLAAFQKTNSVNPKPVPVSAAHPPSPSPRAPPH